MTLKELTNKVAIGPCLGGSFVVEIDYRGKRYDCPCYNTLAYDAISDWKRGCYERSNHHYTPREAYQSLYDFCKMKNNL